MTSSNTAGSRLWAPAYLNFQFSVSMDLFGSEQSTNAGNYYSGGLKGRWKEFRRKDDHLSLEDEAP